MKPRGRIAVSWWPEDKRPDNAEELTAFLEHAIDAAYGSVRFGWTSDGWRVDEASLSTPQVYSGASKLIATQDMRRAVHEVLANAGLFVVHWPY
jgi:hypothetical protein